MAKAESRNGSTGGAALRRGYAMQGREYAKKWEDAQVNGVRAQVWIAGFCNVDWLCPIATSRDIVTWGKAEMVKAESRNGSGGLERGDELLTNL